MISFFPRMWVVDKVYKGIWIFGILYMLYRCFFAG